MTNGKDDAFPTLIVGEDVRGDTGLSKRELFAAMAMQGFLASGDYIHSRVIDGGAYKGWTETDLLGKQSIECADALIAALNKETK